MYNNTVLVTVLLVLNLLLPIRVLSEVLIAPPVTDENNLSILGEDVEEAVKSLGEISRSGKYTRRINK